MTYIEKELLLENVEDLDGTLYCWYFNKNVYEDDFCSNGG